MSSEPPPPPDRLTEFLNVLWPKRVESDRYYWNGQRWVHGAMPRGFRPRLKKSTLFYVRGPRLGPIRFAGTRVTTGGCACLVLVILLATLASVFVLITGS